jgi:hypothetical protein
MAASSAISLCHTKYKIYQNLKTRLRAAKLTIYFAMQSIEKFLRSVDNE